jgi:hypothetical protein
VTKIEEGLSDVYVMLGSCAICFSVSAWIEFHEAQMPPVTDPTRIAVAGLPPLAPHGSERDYPTVLVRDNTLRMVTSTATTTMLFWDGSGFWLGCGSVWVTCGSAEWTACLNYATPSGCCCRRGGDHDRHGERG